MNGEQLQVIGLVGQGNAFLHNAVDPDLIEIAMRPFFRHVARVEFARYESREATSGEAVAESVYDWFQYLKTMETARLWNIAFAWSRTDLPEHVAISFTGAVPVAMQTQSRNGIELWYPRWVHQPENRERPWSIEYRSLVFPQSHALQQAELSAVKANLRKPIVAAEKFARRRDAGAQTWAAWFKKAIQTLDRDEVAPPMDGVTLLPAFGYTRDAHVLVNAAGQADVFGGQGSWNDISFTDQRLRAEYDLVSANLYAAIKFARVMAANSFATNSHS